MNAETKIMEEETYEATYFKQDGTDPRNKGT